MESRNEVAMAMFGKMTQNFSKALQGYIENKEWTKIVCLLGIYAEGQDAVMNNVLNLAVMEFVNHDIHDIDQSNLEELAREIEDEIKELLGDGLAPFLEKAGNLDG